MTVAALGWLRYSLVVAAVSLYAALLSACDGSLSAVTDTPAPGSNPTAIFVSSTAAPPATLVLTTAGTPTAAAAPSATSAPAAAPTARPSLAATPALRAFAGLIAFVSDRFDHPEVYLYDIDRNEVIQWTSDSAAKRNPAWAPDGRTLAYAALRDGTWQIYKKSISGGRESRLTSPPGDNYEPAWSADGKSIAFTSNRDGREQVYLMDAEGRNSRNLTKTTVSDFQPAWSPDSKWIAFSTNRDGNWEIYAMMADGSNPRNLSRSAGGDWSPAWSPDGTRLAFVSDRDGNSEVYTQSLADLESPSASNVSRSSGSDWSPTWSPDGSRLTFVSKRDGNFELYMADADGGNARRVTNEMGDDTQPAWRWEPGTVAAPRVPPFPPAAAGAVALDPGPKQVTIWHLDDNPRVDGMRSAALQALGQDETAYATSAGQVFGFEPGDWYQQIYIRDQSWMNIPAMYFYPARYARDSVEEFLRRQYNANQPIRPLATTFPGDGAISGLFSPEITYDKHTTTSDEETNLIRAAHVYWSFSGDNAWLKKDIAGQTVIARLNRAMEWLLTNRIDPATSLVKRAHTTDWGDVKIEKTGSPTELAPGDALAASLFDQAMAYQALRNLAEMNRAAGNASEAGRYSGAANDLRGQVEKWMWQPTRGFYRSIWHLTPLDHKFDEDAIVSIVNALMVYTGLSERTAALDKLEEATKAVGAIKPGLSLHPPYPIGVFAYVQMAEGAYQNGGLWDWWGGTQITAEFERGLRGRALRHLYQVADDWNHHPRDIYEWQYARTGVNKGSNNYGGSVATMTEAIVRGLYGMRLEAQNMTISPRLADKSGWIRAAIPSSGLFAAYRYDVKGAAIQIQYETNYAKDVPFSVAMPEKSVAKSVAVDGQTVNFKSDVFNEDNYATFTAPTGTHTIAITFGAK